MSSGELNTARQILRQRTNMVEKLSEESRQRSRNKEKLELCDTFSMEGREGGRCQSEGQTAQGNCRESPKGDQQAK